MYERPQTMCLLKLCALAAQEALSALLPSTIRGEIKVRTRRLILSPFGVWF